ncbi:MAG: DNA-binding domain-containing protein [Methylophilaceae bacterium]
MSHLAGLQAEFQAYLLGSKQNSPFPSCIADDAKLGAVRRLDIYYHAYRLRLIEALSTAYPKLHALLGDDLFEDIARSYIDAYPSTYRNVRWYGAAMRMHLASTLPQHPIVAEMADFEWTLALAFDAADTPVLQIQDLVAIAPEDWAALSFKLQPSLHLLPLRWNTVAVWQALDVEETPPACEQKSSPETWLIWRQALNPRFRSLDAMEASALDLAISCASFGDICASVNSQLEEEASTIQAAQYLAGWLADEMIAGFSA